MRKYHAQAAKADLAGRESWDGDVLLTHFTSCCQSKWMQSFERMQGYASSTQNKSIEIVHSSNSSVAKDETSSHPPTSHRSKMLPTFGEAEAYFKIVIFPTQQKCAKGSNDNIHHQLLWTRWISRRCKYVADTWHQTQKSSISVPLLTNHNSE